jgi:hypothetical protein
MSTIKTSIVIQPTNVVWKYTFTDEPLNFQNVWEILCDVHTLVTKKLKEARSEDFVHQVICAVSDDKIQYTLIGTFFQDNETCKVKITSPNELEGNPFIQQVIKDYDECMAPFPRVQ